MTNPTPTETENKHRKKFVLLLAALALAFVYLRNDYRKRLLGTLFLMYGSTGTIPTSQLANLRAKVLWELLQFQQALVTEMMGRQADTIQFGAALGGEISPSPETQAVAGEVLTNGALGVPFAEVSAAAMVQAANNISGMVTRSTLDKNKSLVDIDKNVSTVLETITNKLSNEAFTQLAGAFTVATVTAVQANPEIEEMLYVLNPQSDNHCSWCASRSGNIYPKSHPVWSQLPAHPNCYCYGLPITTRAGVESNQELVA